MSQITEVFQVVTDAGNTVDVLIRRDPSGATYAFARFDRLLTGRDFDRLYDEACSRCGCEHMELENRGSYLRLSAPPPLRTEEFLDYHLGAFEQPG